MPKKKPETIARERRESQINMLAFSLNVLDDHDIGAIRAIDSKLVDKLVEEQFDLTQLHLTLRGLTLPQIEKLRTGKYRESIKVAYIAGTLEPEETDADKRLSQALATPIPRRRKKS